MLAIPVHETNMDLIKAVNGGDPVPVAKEGKLTFLCVEQNAPNRVIDADDLNRLKATKKVRGMSRKIYIVT